MILMSLKYGACVRTYPQIAKIFQKIYEERQAEVGAKSETDKSLV